MLIHNGAPAAVPDADKVRNNIVFRPGMPNTSVQKAAWQGMGLHWTGAENPARVVTDTLIARRLSVQFIVEKDGQIVQTADLNTMCAHIGSPGNQRYIGVEVVCRGYADKTEWQKAKLRDPSLRDRTQLDWKTPRDMYEDVIGGQRVRLAGFNREQLQSVVWLSETCAGMFGFPRQIPAYIVDPARLGQMDLPVPNPEAFLVEYAGKKWLPYLGRDARRNGLAATHRGALGHFHVHEVKHDPGSQMMYALWAEGWNPAQLPLPGVAPF
jgi:hypothetical protein